MNRLQKIFGALTLLAAGVASLTGCDRNDNNLPKTSPRYAITNMSTRLGVLAPYLIVDVDGDFTPEFIAPYNVDSRLIRIDWVSEGFAQDRFGKYVKTSDTKVMTPIMLSEATKILMAESSLENMLNEAKAEKAGQ